VVTTEGLVIRAGDLETDRPVALEMFRRYLNPRYDVGRFDWMYRRNPHGPGRLWVATDASGDSVVGVAGAFPRRMYVAGREELALVLGDFCVSDRHRSLGPALCLQRACLSAVSTGGIGFCYDFPSPRMMAVYQRIGVGARGQMIRLRRLLRVDTRLRQIVVRPALIRGMSTLGNLLLASRIPHAPGVVGLTVAFHAGWCGEEFSEVASRWSAQHGVSVQRSAEYLNWRYLANPICRHEMMTARQDGALVGYLVFTADGHTATLVDMLAADVAIVVRLVRALVELAWRRGLDTVTVTLLASHPWVRLLKRVGFRKRERSPVVVYAPNATARSGADDGLAWLLLCGDRDS
jgi:hypothetical protein